MSTAATAVNPRFQDNTTTRPVDRRRVYGYGPGNRMSMSPRASNVAGYNIPQGQLICFKPRVDGHMEKKMKSVKNRKGEAVLAYDGQTEFSGPHFAEAVAAKFQNGKLDFGFRILDCLTDLDYDRETGYDEADAYFNLLHPALECEMGLEKVLYGSAGDLLNDGLPWPCPTCRVEWLESTQCQEAIFSSNLDHNRLESLRQILLQSPQKGLIYAQVRLDKAKAEVESPEGKKIYDDADRHYMKLLHKKEKHVEQAEIQAEAARIQGEAIGLSVASAISAQSDKNELEQLRRENAELKAAKNGSAESAEDVKIDKRTKEYKESQENVSNN